MRAIVRKFDKELDKALTKLIERYDIPIDVLDQYYGGISLVELICLLKKRKEVQK